MTRPRTKFLYKLLLLVLVPLAATQIVTLFAVSNTAETAVVENAERQLTVSAQVVDEYLRNREEQIANALSVLVSDFALKSVISTDDAPSIQSAIDNHRERVGAAFATYHPESSDQLAKIAGQTIDTSILTNEENLDSNIIHLPALVIQRDLYQLFAAPVKAPVTIGYVIFAYQLDQSLVEAMKALTGTDISLGHQTDGQIQWLASTRSTGLADQHSSFSGQSQVSGPAENRWLTLTSHMGPSNPNVRLAVHISLHEAMAPYLKARNALMALGVVVTLIAAGFGIWFSGTVSRPLRRLALATQRMRDGHYDSKVPWVSNDEFGQLANSFNNLQNAIQDREQRILHSARHDPLTNLPNYAYVKELLQQYLQAQPESPHCVAQLHLARLRDIQSSLGQDTTDRMVLELTEKLADPINECGGVLGQSSTDQLTIIYPNTAAPQAGQRLLLLLQEFEQGIAIESARLQLPISIGMAVYPDHADKAEHLLRFANIAAQDAISQQQEIVAYAEGREEKFARRLQIVNDLPNALLEQQLFTVYQPKVTLATGQINTVEALVRWVHPELGFLNPDEFIGAAEDGGSITQLTYYVVQQALEDACRWQQAGIDIDVAVNLSTRDLLHEHFCQNIKQLLDYAGVAATKLVLEVTESCMMEQPDRAVETLERLRTMGIKIAMDDFGTGHSSLAQLASMPIDQLKIDRAFVQTLQSEPINQQIVANTIDLAHNMGLNVVAEGVEDEFAMYHLTRLGCEYAQGYFISKPQTYDDLTQWMHTYQPKVYIERRSADRPFSRQPAKRAAKTPPALPSRIGIRKS